MKYALYFVPHELEREKLALLRRQLCKRFNNRKAVMYPIHLTLIRTIELEDPKGFTTALEPFCKSLKPVKMQAEKNLTTRTGWGGIEIKESRQLSLLQEQLIELARDYGGVEPYNFDPHVSMVYARQLPSLTNRTSPVKKILLDRISLVLQTTPGTPYRIVKHFHLG
ncbi:hypothetical protein GOV11_03875 [Candidatus Woesearchaeota archaeon]|nr:hypothetical protein [Candidatus Woesearchaeota archaeon]